MHGVIFRGNSFYFEFHSFQYFFIVRPRYQLFAEFNQIFRNLLENVELKERGDTDVQMYYRYWQFSHRK